MRDAFSNVLQNAIQLAQLEARAHNQQFVGTEHLLLGVISASNSEVHEVLESLHMDGACIRRTLLAELPTANDQLNITGDLPLTPKAQRAINSAIVKAHTLREETVSSRFMLLALIEESNSLIGNVIRTCGGDVNQLRVGLVESHPDREA